MALEKEHQLPERGGPPPPQRSAAPPPSNQIVLTQKNPPALAGAHQVSRDAVFIAPEAGPNVELNGMVVGVISPSSPLGSAMEELEAGDAFEVDSPTGVVEYEVYNVR